MAAIISVQTATKAATPSPIVPVIPVMPRAICTVATQAPAARISRAAAHGARAAPSALAAAPEPVTRSPGPEPVTRTPGPEPVTRSPGPGERRGETALPLPPPLDPERGQLRHPGRRHRERGVRRVGHVRQLDRVRPLAGDVILNGHAGDVPDRDFVAAPVLAVVDA